jgi:hypothetical protein
LRVTRSVALRVVGSLAFRVACYSVMVWCALYAEAWPSPSAALPDVLLDRVPYVAWVDQNNYLVWLVAYVPIALWLMARDAERFIRYMVTSGVVALVRGACIMVTGLPAISGGHGALSFEQRWSAWLHLTTPLGFFDRDSGARVALTRDLFFSGHTATTFLLLLYVWRFPKLRWPMLAAHAVVMACVAFAHLHYAIDVIGAYAVTFSVYVLREWKPASVATGVTV